MIQAAFEGLLLGLSTGAYCIGTCLVFFMPYLLAEGRKRLFENLQSILSFMLGRLLSYISFALLISFLGMRYRDIFTNKFSYIGLIIVSSLMLIYALTRNFGELKFCQRLLHHFSSRGMPFVLGMLSGLHPCMPFLAGALRLWELKSLLLGLILFLAFFLGTSVYMVPLLFISYLNRIERLKQIGLMMVFLSGLWFLWIGILGVIR
jgi:sulfite exporter TauE/SafE